MSAVLTVARAMSYEVGSNLKGTSGGAAWTWLLPNLDVDVALVIGRVDAAELRALGRLASRVVEVTDDRGIAALVEGPSETLDRGVDLLRLGRGAMALLERRAGAIQRLLSEAGCIFLDAAADRAPAALAELLVPLRAPQVLSLAPRFGITRVIHTGLDGRVASILKELGHLPPKGGQRLAARIENRIGGLVTERADRRATLAVPQRDLPLGPPRYVREIAAGAHYPLAGDTWALLAPGDYPSQKVLLLLIDSRTATPTCIVKIGTEPSHRSRLDNEARALRAIAQLDLPPSGRVPAIAFAGEAARRGVVGEEWIRAGSFSRLVTGGLDPVVEGAVAWLAALGLATARPVPAHDVGHALRDLLTRFDATFTLTDREMTALDWCVTTIEHHPGQIPVVRQHGDPGAWNLLVDDDGRIVFLDWESSERAGIPLWDIFYLQRSIGATVARRAGVRRGLDAAMRHFSSATPLQARFVEQIGSHATELGLDRALIEPLFYACWMHRALKEATRRTPAAVAGGHYLRLLRALLARRDTQPLRRLTGSARRP